jgi:hypothetical protein
LIYVIKLACSIPETGLVAKPAAAVIACRKPTTNLQPNKNAEPKKQSSAKSFH